MRIAAALLAALFLQEARDDAGKAISNVRSQKSYRTKFKAVIEAPGSDSLTIEGESVWVNPGVLYIQYTGSGGDQKRIIRVGEKVWVYHELLADWVTSEEMGTPGAGRGVQNPDDVLGVVAKYADRAKPAGGAVEIRFSGEDIEKIMKEQASQGTFDFKKSTATARLFVKDNLLARFTSAAELTSIEENLKGKIVKYSADVQVVGYGKDTSLVFTIPDEKTRKPVEIGVPEHIRKEIAGFLAKKP